MRIPLFLVLVALSACGNNGAPPYPAEATPATPFATTGRASTVTSRAPAGAPVGATAGAPGGGADPRVLYELREKCAEDARLWHRHFFATGAHPPHDVASQGFTSHYDSKTNDCLAVTRSVNGHTAVHRLTDVLENRDIGTFVSPSEAASPSECHVGEQVCTSQQEWDKLTAPYMND